MAVDARGKGDREREKGGKGRGGVKNKKRAKRPILLHSQFARSFAQQRFQMENIVYFHFNIKPIYTLMGVLGGTVILAH